MRSTIAILALALAGCAGHQGAQYHWGGYDKLLYTSYKEPGKAAKVQGSLEAHIAALEQRHLVVPPGLYAEVGTFYMQNGNTDKAVAFYTKERDAWPESRTLMDSLIQRAAAAPKSPDKESAS